MTCLCVCGWWVMGDGRRIHYTAFITMYSMSAVSISNGTLATHRFYWQNWIHTGRLTLIAGTFRTQFNDYRYFCSALLIDTEPSMYGGNNKWIDIRRDTHIAHANQSHLSSTQWRTSFTSETRRKWIGSIEIDKLPIHTPSFCFNTTN